MKFLLKRVSDNCKQVFTMLGNKFTHAEMLEVMGWDNIQSAKNQVYRCRQKLRTLIQANPAIAEIINKTKWRTSIK